jgi:hypothetical protein
VERKRPPLVEGQPHYRKSGAMAGAIRARQPHSPSVRKDHPRPTSSAAAMHSSRSTIVPSVTRATPAAQSSALS